MKEQKEKSFRFRLSLKKATSKPRPVGDGTRRPRSYIRDCWFRKIERQCAPHEVIYLQQSGTMSTS